jgi:membrane protein YdbS with pleckstrin-like domain
MIGWIEGQVLRLMKVPGEPQAPEGTAGSIRMFRSGRNYYRWRVMIWMATNCLVLLLMAILLFIDFLGTRRAPPLGRAAGAALAVAVVAGFLASLLFTFVQQHLNYQLRWYVVTDRCLRVRSGILSVHEITTTFANIQEVRLSSGPLQKVLGLADVEVHSAGGGGGKGSEGGHVAAFAGVDNAPEIRDFILERLRHYRDSGLGEKDAAHATASSEGSVAAAQAVLAEVRALRESMGRAAGV